NTYPARVFMGDTGSLALGGAVGVVALLSKSALWIPLMGFLFMGSTISVIIQVISYKKRKKRVFKMAPIHHHFELLGYPETKITAMYIIITAILCLIGVLAFLQ
ncbi:MAG: phospho-N-acetylmuramoyl-pentapeptide-transferase, partial [Clostridiales bacterium]|nr:phospho-N-acetylmuramoyl-pentapeptide-transferase [Clostridiales bacterium]